MKRMIPGVIVLTALLGHTQLAGQGMQADPDKNVQGGGTLPAGWQARLDRADAKMEAVKFVTMGMGVHATTGPAAIFYEATMTAGGAFDALATFTQTKPSEHPEAYGLFIGGTDLSGPSQKYTYFLIRQDGKFLIKRRIGADTKNVMDWTDHGAIKKADASGKMTNALAIAAAKDTVRFLVNGTEVASLPVAQLDVSGIVGLRVNHNLDVNIDGFALKTAPSH